MARTLREYLGEQATLAVDETTVAMHLGMPTSLPRVRTRDAGSILSPAKLCKTADEIECIRRAQRINELAMYDVHAALGPGMRQSELTGILLRRMFDLGVTGNAIDPIWQVMPASRAAGPYTTNGEVAFPLTTTDRILAEGDVIWVDSGVNYQGYSSDFGRTWLVSRDPDPGPRRRDQYKRWRLVMDATLGQIRPGATGGDLTRSAADAAGGERPWLSHFYLIHGVGTDSAEMPLIGTDLGPAFDDGIVLAPGMVMVLEPVIWDEGCSGYRSEDIVAVTEDGYVTLTDYPYFPYD